MSQNKQDKDIESHTAGNDTQKDQLEEVTGAITTTPLSTYPNNFPSGIVDVDSLEPVEPVHVPSASENSLTITRKAVTKGRPKETKMKQTEEPFSKLGIIWDASKLNEEEFADEVANSYGAYAHTNKWSVNNLKDTVRQQQEKINSLKDIIRQQEQINSLEDRLDSLQQQKALNEIEHQQQISLLKQQEEKINSLKDTIRQQQEKNNSLEDRLQQQKALNEVEHQQQINLLKQQEEKINSLEYRLQQQKALSESEHQQQINQLKHVLKQRQLEKEYLERRLKQENAQLQETCAKAVADIIVEKDNKMNQLLIQIKELQDKQSGLEFLKKEALKSNEQLKESQEQFYQKLSQIQKYHKTLNEFSNIVKDKLSQQKIAQDAFEKLKSWQAKHILVPASIMKFRISNEGKLKTQIALDNWLRNLNFAHNLITNSTRYCSNLWDSAMDIIIDFDMPNVQLFGEFDFDMPNVQLFGETVSSELCITDLQQQRKETENLIKGIDRWTMQSIFQFLVNPLTCSKVINNFLLKYCGEISVIASKVYSCEINVDESTPKPILHILKIYSPWETYVDEIEKLKAADQREDLSKGEGQNFCNKIFLF